MNESKASSRRNQQQQNRRKPRHWKQKRRNQTPSSDGKNTTNTSNDNNKSSNLFSRTNNKRSANEYIDVYTSDFEGFHQRCLKMGMVLPIKYKIHRPKSTDEKLNAKLKNGILRVVDSDLEMEGNHENLDRMIVRPDTKGLRIFFLGKDTTAQAQFKADPRGTERRLQQQIEDSFRSPTILSSDQDKDDAPHRNHDVIDQLTGDMATLLKFVGPIYDSKIMKFSCAACLLQEEPNGFACVASASSQIIEKVRDWTRKQALNVSSEEKATDHGDFVLCLPKNLLWEFLQAKKATSKAVVQRKQPNSSNKKSYRAPRSSGIRPLSNVQDDILFRMGGQGVSVEANKKGGRRLKLGHHLESLLHLIVRDRISNNRSNSSKNFPNNNGINQSPNDIHLKSNQKLSQGLPGDEYMLIYGFDDSTDHQGIWEINIPGGKRLLGETSLQAAMRETKEEISLQWDESWVVRVFQNKKNPFEKINRYYLLHPPDPDALADGGLE